MPNDSAYDQLAARLTEWGLPSLIDVIWGYLTEGLSADSAALRLQDTPEWKTRFAGNEERKRAGLPVLDPSTYLSLEQSYRQVMRTYGLPEGYMDSPADFARAMGSDMSPTELSDRLALRERVYTRGLNTGVFDYMHTEYGLTRGDVVAFFTDPDAALPLLTKQVTASEIGAAAARTKFGQLGGAQALRLAELGVDESAAIAGFAEIAELENLTMSLPGSIDNTVTQDELLRARFESDTAAQRQIRKVATQRTAEFGGGGFAATEEGVTGLRVAGE